MTTRVMRSAEEVEKHYADLWRRINNPTEQDMIDMARSMQENDDEAFAAIDAEEARLKAVQEAQNHE